MDRHHAVVAQERRRKLIASISSLVTLAAAIASFPCHSQSSAWKPTKNVELVSPASPGSGSDRTVRLIQKIWQEKRLVEGSSSVVNKPGAGQGVGFFYLNQHAGDGHYLAPLSPSFLASNIVGTQPIGHADVTPIALLITEHIAFSVNAGSPIRNGKDLVDKLKKDPSATTIAVAPALGNHEHVAFIMVAKAAGVDFKKVKTVVFNGTPEAMAALMGGHVDLALTPGATVAGAASAGKARVIAVSAPQRLRGIFANTPTWKEQGVDVVSVGWRGIVGPKGLNIAQAAYWEGVFEQVVQAPEWKQDVENNYWDNNYLPSEEFRKFLQARNDEMKQVLTELGLAK